MEIDRLIESGLTFFIDNPLWAALIALALGILVFLKPKAMFKLALAVLVLGAIVYVGAFLLDLTSRGIDDTKKFTTHPGVKVD